MIKYLFRVPVFPIICDTQDLLIGAENHDQFVEQVKVIRNNSKDQFTLVDSSSEGWVLNVSMMAVSPLTLDKIWTKKKIIEMFNRSNESEKLDFKYPLKSLSSKRFDRILYEIVLLIQEAHTLTISNN